MKNYPLEKYRFYQTPDGKVIAASTFGGKCVRGVAKCSGEDNFDLEKGKELAAARCNLKVAEKRLGRATKKLALAYENLYQAQKEVDKMREYMADSREAYMVADSRVQKMLEKL